MQECKIAFCQGSNGGSAIYVLDDDDFGTRIFGEKCYRSIKTVRGFNLTIDNIDRTIKELKYIKKIINNKKKQSEKVSTKSA